MVTKNSAGRAALDETEHQALSALIATHGEGAVIHQTRLSRTSFYRALARLPVTEGTRELIRATIASGVTA